jgi:hypothetical protein
MSGNLSVWPTKPQREQYEMDQFIYHYGCLTGRELQVLSRGEQPDYVVRDPRAGDEFGVELTSVYVTDSEVPHEHLPPGDKWLHFSQTRVQAYEARLVEAILSKTKKAKTAYDMTRPLLLSVYANGHDSIYVDWDSFLQALCARIKSVDPFREVLFWPLPGAMPERDDAPIAERAALWKPTS